jgi:hypothetical protein
MSAQRTPKHAFRAGERSALDVTRRELATILGALRFHQAENLQAGREIPDQSIRQIATDGGQFDHLDSREVDDLCQRLNVGERSRPRPSMVIDPPPEERGEEPLFRVVYAIDVSAASPQAAARQVHRIMADGDSLPPVLDVMDHRGKVVRIDLAEK